jgi:hypothetical protein
MLVGLTAERYRSSNANDSALAELVPLASAPIGHGRPRAKFRSQRLPIWPAVHTIGLMLGR